jgi:hypothetical protein
MKVGSGGEEGAGRRGKKCERKKEVERNCEYLNLLCCILEILVHRYTVRFHHNLHEMWTTESCIITLAAHIIYRSGLANGAYKEKCKFLHIIIWIIDKPTDN